MSLLSGLREKQAGKVATATPATIATHAVGERRTVAGVATVDVARLSQGRTADREKVGVTAVTTSRWWLMHYSNRDPLEVACCPEVTYADILEQYPDAVAAEPFTPTIRQLSGSLAASEETRIRAWLALIEETDPATIAEVIGQCQRDADARDYFIGCAVEEQPKPDPYPDDRRTCEQCANLIAKRCQAAKRGEIVASQSYEPIRNLPRRCEAYAPRADDLDRRHGWERWQGLK